VSAKARVGAQGQACSRHGQEAIAVDKTPTPAGVIADHFLRFKAVVVPCPHSRSQPDAIALVASVLGGYSSTEQAATPLGSIAWCFSGFDHRCFSFFYASLTVRPCRHSLEKAPTGFVGGISRGFRGPGGSDPKPAHLYLRLVFRTVFTLLGRGFLPWWPLGGHLSLAVEGLHPGWAHLFKELGGQIPLGDLLCVGRSPSEHGGPKAGCTNLCDLSKRYERDGCSNGDQTVFCSWSPGGGCKGHPRAERGGWQSQLLKLSTGRSGPERSGRGAKQRLWQGREPRAVDWGPGRAGRIGPGAGRIRSGHTELGGPHRRSGCWMDFFPGKTFGPGLKGPTHFLLLERNSQKNRSNRFCFASCMMDEVIKRDLASNQASGDDGDRNG